jgi:hypothetical protein
MFKDKTLLNEDVIFFGRHTHSDEFLDLINGDKAIIQKRQQEYMKEGIELMQQSITQEKISNYDATISLIQTAVYNFEMAAELIDDNVEEQRNIMKNVRIYKLKLKQLKEKKKVVDNNANIDKSKDDTPPKNPLSTPTKHEKSEEPTPNHPTNTNISTKRTRKFININWGGDKNVVEGLQDEKSVIETFINDCIHNFRCNNFMESSTNMQSSPNTLFLFGPPGNGKTLRKFSAFTLINRKRIKNQTLIFILHTYTFYSC